jgi:gamma-glutamyltranspeptidase/glutathione hydrolase
MKIRDFHLPGRSPVLAAHGMAATSHPLATLAAVEALKAGGTAADAAVAAVAVLCVVEPAMTGIGGDCFCLVAKPGAPVWGYNGSGRAAAAATTEKLLAQGLPRKIPATSPHAVTVPGAIEAWDAILKAHGRLGLDRALQPAIAYAENGFPIAPRVGTDWSACRRSPRRSRRSQPAVRRPSTKARSQPTSPQPCSRRAGFSRSKTSRATRATSSRRSRPITAASTSSSFPPTARA